jgi:hypothetical protein
MHPRLSDRDGLMLAGAYELQRPDVAADALVIETWQLPVDDLVVWLSRRHGWHAELSVSYLTALRMVCCSPSQAEELPVPSVMSG